MPNHNAAVPLLHSNLPAEELAAMPADVQAVERPVKRVVTRSPRETVVAEMRRLADALERGDLEGARIEWRDGQPRFVRVELDHKNNEVRFDVVELVTLEDVNK